MRKEFFAGFTTFLTMSYIIVVNPSILSTPGTGMSFSGVLTATVLLSFLMTLLMGVYAELPLAVAPGMGLNAFFTFSLILGEKIPWNQALGMVFWAGVFFLIISLTPIREKMAKSLSQNMKIATSVGIGLFLCLIGLKSAGIIVADQVTFVKMGEFNSSSVLSVLGFILIFPLFSKKNPLAFILPIFLITLISFLLGMTHAPLNFVSMPDFETVFFKLDFWGPLKWSMLPAILTIMFTDLFDSISTFVGVSRASGLHDKDGNPLRLREGLIVDAFATMFAGLFGTSSGTAFIESASGVEAGGRTKWTAIFCSLFFLPFFFLSPMLEMIPAYATAPVLIFVGLLMFQHIKEIDFTHIQKWMPAVVTIVLIPFSFSITKGLVAGVLLEVVFRLLSCWRKTVRE